MYRIHNALLLAIAILAIGCTSPTRRVNVGEQFALRPKEEVAVADTGINIRLNEVGHQTFSGPTPSRRAAAYVVLFVTASNGSKTIRLDVGDDEPVGDFLIKVNSANPFNSDNGPRCELTVTKKS